MSNIHFIINPAGNGGAGLRVWEAFKTEWSEPIAANDVSFTTHAGHARNIASEAGGCEILAVAGGDGTVSEVISGIMTLPEPRPKLAVIPCGTGNDISQNAGISNLEDAHTALRSTVSRAFDLIRVDRESPAGTESRHAFLFANAGFSAIPMMKPWMKRLLGSTRAYYLSTLLQVLVYHPPEMSISVDGKTTAGKRFMVIAGNAEYAGGGSMRIAPNARTDDGWINISIIRSVSKMKLITHVLSSIADGSHIDQPEVAYFSGTQIRIESEPAAPLDLDGELFGTTPATFTVCPQALEMICLPVS